MDAFLELLACLKCEGPLRSDLSCRDCGMGYEAPDGIPNLRMPGDERTEVVRSFYAESPFPDYPPRAGLNWLRGRAERSEFARLIDRAIPGDARIVEISVRDHHVATTEDLGKAPQSHRPGSPAHSQVNSFHAYTLGLAREWTATSERDD